MNFLFRLSRTALVAAALLISAISFAQDIRAIRASVGPLLPAGSEINAVSPTPFPGLFELRYNDVRIAYTDAQGKYLIDGALIEVASKVNITAARSSELLAVNFNDLPLKDAVVTVRDAGTRKIAVFLDPNCGYCKRFEQELAKARNVTIYTFLYPVLGPDSKEKSANIWCSTDKQKTLSAWMHEGTVPPASQQPCDSTALNRIMEFGRAHSVTGTPTLFFASGRRVPGVVDSARLEQLLSGSK